MRISLLILLNLLFFSLVAIVAMSSLKGLKQYKDNLFFRLHLFFISILFLHTPYVMIANRYAAKFAIEKINDLQNQICLGQELDMKQWTHTTKNYYRYEFRVLGEPYILRCVLQDDGKTFSVGAFHTYDQIAPYINGGPDKCGRRKIDQIKK